VQQALEHADSPLQVPTSVLPGEFVKISKAVSLLLEARYTDHKDLARLRRIVGHQKRRREQYNQMVKTLQSSLEHEQSSGPGSAFLAGGQS